MLRGGLQQVRVVVKRALALLQLDTGVSAPHVAMVVPLTAEAVRQIAARYRTGSRARSLFDRARRNF